MACAEMFTAMAGEAGERGETLGILAKVFAFWRHSRNRKRLASRVSGGFRGRHSSSWRRGTGTWLFLGSLLLCLESPISRPASRRERLTQDLQIFPQLTRCQSFIADNCTWRGQSPSDRQALCLPRRNGPFSGPDADGIAAQLPALGIKTGDIRPLVEIAEATGQHRLSGSVGPPCWRAMICSTWKRTNREAACGNRQFSQTSSARRRTSDRRALSITAVCAEQAGLCLQDGNHVDGVQIAGILFPFLGGQPFVGSLGEIVDAALYRIVRP